jgi:hypothetical protein
MDTLDGEKTGDRVWSELNAILMSIAPNDIAFT